MQQKSPRLIRNRQLVRNSSLPLVKFFRLFGFVAFVLLLSFHGSFLTEYRESLSEWNLIQAVSKMCNATASTTREIDPKDMKQERRTKFHHCFWRPHSNTPAIMLKNDYGFKQTDAAKDDDWDLIFGGYPHCGTERWDWQMKTGLNAQLAEKGWNTFQPHQVWFPCMGCASSLCNKRELCRIQRQTDPRACYLLPDDEDDLLIQMTADKGKLWVVKRDGHFLHIHSGSGVWVIDSPDGLPKDTEDETYLVQPYSKPWVGEGNYRRKSEVRFYVAITSTSPFRVYVYSTPWVSISSMLYTAHGTDNATDLEAKCMHDSHAHRRECQSVSSPLGPWDNKLLFDEYGKRVNMSMALQKSYVAEAQEILVDIFKSSSVMGSHEVNRGITESGASCFSFMRADFGITLDGKPFLYEINEFPFANEKCHAGEVIQAAYHDLFKMIGLAEKPLAPQHRAEYEKSHLGGWILLPTDSAASSC